ncbi:hypothetical protein C0Q70_18603 [Pomacea canaliculata]|uniref:Uncharacterized protein n=1 Tax=Pomacea canaliculata TaxID=400727 RepID=A0A2T7NGZ0_POMCA|nr:hypothetical protein C0Q70_18603 [Pomacea canaliculata]
MSRVHVVTDLSLAKKVWRVLWVFLRLGLLLGCLYLFICSLGLLEDSFQLLGGKTAGKTFQNDKLLSNPVAGLMIGVLATVLVQSSSTSTSIVITMVGSGIISIKIAIPIIMGANIGTSVTNTLVSLAQASDRNEFRRAFAGATVDKNVIEKMAQLNSSSEDIERPERHGGGCGAAGVLAARHLLGAVRHRQGAALAAARLHRQARPPHHQRRAAGPRRLLHRYLAILFGTGMTMILQSSSVFTPPSPAGGRGIVSVERMYPLTLGSNIGTTVTGILAALSQEGDHLINALHVALCHLFFNITGIVLFYPLPFMRLPVDLAKSLGNTTAKHRWFAILYILLLFIVFPAAVFGLSVAGWVYLGSIGGTFFVIFVAIVAINVIQRKRRGCLPPVLRTWDFLPHWLHSLKPIDIVIAKVFNCRCCQRLQEADKGERSPDKEVEITVEVKCDDQKAPAAANGHVNEGADFEEHRL